MSESRWTVMGRPGVVVGSFVRVKDAEYWCERVRVIHPDAYIDPDSTKSTTDESIVPSPDPRGDGLCPNCPTDLSTLDTGHSVCLECGWTSNPSKIFELYNRIDELQDKLERMGGSGQ